MVRDVRTVKKTEKLGFFHLKNWYGKIAIGKIGKIGKIEKNSFLQLRVERIWSSFGKTHTTVRNRLTNERVSKLVAIRSHLNILNPLTPSSNTKPASTVTPTSLTGKNAELERISPESSDSESSESEAHSSDEESNASASDETDVNVGFSL